MFPILAIAAANVGRNLIQNASAQINKPPAQATDPAAFQKFLLKAASSPEVQKASFFSSERIHNTADAQQRLSDYGSRIMQDPEVQKAVAGNSGAVEMRFSPDGVVSIKTSDGRQRTVHLQGDAKAAAQKAEIVSASLKTATQPALAAPLSAPAPSGVPQASGIRIVPGSGTSTLLA